MANSFVKKAARMVRGPDTWVPVRRAPGVRGLLTRFCLAMGVLALTVAMAQAAPTSDGALPWDTPIDRIGQALSGPVAFLFALGGLIVCGVRWIFGGEMGAMTRTLLTTIIGLCLLVLATRFIQVLFGVTSALVAG